MFESRAEGLPASVVKVRRPDVVVCAWCRAEVTVPPRGRVPQWCGPACRHRAWEQRRAAASGRSATEIVERIVTVEVPVIRTERVQLPPATPRGADWAPLLVELTRQLDTGRIYPRDMPALTQTLEQVIAAINRRTHTGHRR
jgi:hypothetical protein